LAIFLENKILAKILKNLKNLSWSPRPIIFTEKKIGKIRPIFNSENDFENQNFWMFKEAVNNVGKSDATRR
jgi:hypothetical protein